MTDTRRTTGTVPTVPAGDEETAGHPAHDPVIGVSGEEDNGVQPRDREAKLAADAGHRPRSGGTPEEGRGRSFTQQDTDG